MATVTRNLPLACGNVTCPNRPGEGQFTLVTVEAAPPISSKTSPRRDVTLYLCGPCAAVLNPPPTARCDTLPSATYYVRACGRSHAGYCADADV